MRILKSLVGRLSIHQKQAEKLGIKPYTRLSGLLEKASLRLSANESFQDAEAKIEALTGVKVGHSTQQRVVGRQAFEFPNAKQSVNEISVDGGKVRLRHLKDSQSPWRDYKAVRLGGIYYGAFFQDNPSLIDYINSQALARPVICLGTGTMGCGTSFVSLLPLKGAGKFSIGIISNRISTR